MGEMNKPIWISRSLRNVVFHKFPSRITPMARGTKARAPAMLRYLYMTGRHDLFMECGTGSDRKLSASPRKYGAAVLRNEKIISPT